MAIARESRERESSSSSSRDLLIVRPATKSVGQVAVDLGLSN